jgi:hypothetical protein
MKSENEGVLQDRIASQGSGPEPCDEILPYLLGIPRLLNLRPQQSKRENQ